MKRYLSLLALLLITLVTVTACGDNPPAVTTDTSPETEAPAADLEILRDGVANYTIVRGEKADQDTVSAASLLLKTFGQKAGVFPELTTDWIKPGESYAADAREILVGTTGHSESPQVLEGLPYGDYIITTVGSRIVINAWNTAALNEAVNVFADEMAKADPANFSIPANYRKTGTFLAQVNALPAYADSTPSIIYPAGDENYLLLFKDTEKEAYRAYLKAMENAGFTLYTHNEITENAFATYVNDKYTVNIGYYDYEKSVRLIIEPRRNLPGLEADNQYTVKTTPKFAMFGLEFPHSSGDVTQNGLCFIWQLSDGSYIIVDGGFNRDTDAQNIYKYLYANAPDKQNITIAAWILTHAHVDHHGAFFKLSKNYGSKINVELVVGNFPSLETMEAGGQSDEIPYFAKIMQHIEDYHKNARFIKAHVGQKFFLRDAEVEMLYTLESYSPRTLDYFNTSSLIFTLEIAGQRFLILGDASNHSCTIAHAMYGDYLKSDFIHAAHHGYGTGSSTYLGVTDVYDAAAAPVVLWPVGARDYASIGRLEQSAHLQKLASTKEIFVAGARQVILPLPYTAGTGKIDSIRK